MKAKGHVFKYGDNVDTDVIIPARYLNSFDAEELASHAMADIDPDFVKKVQPGDLIVANKNFGCGSSREHAPLCLKTAGVAALSRRHLQGSSIEMPSISGSRSLSARRRQRGSRQETRLKWILTAVRYITGRKAPNSRDRRFQNSCRS